jgi:hypothetical protein
MGTTGTLLPYPEPTAPVRDGAAAIKALADRLTVQTPAPRLWFAAAGYSTNGTGDIAVQTALGAVDGGLIILSGTGVVTWAKLTGAPPGVLWFRAYGAGGAPVASTFLAVNIFAWGS